MNDHRNTQGVDGTPLRRSQGQIVVARGLWYVKPGEAELRTERLPPLPPGHARVKTEFSALSRGTERIVASGKVPEGEWQRMRAPFQDGEFSFPLKYGYAAVGVVTAGSEDIVGRRVFALHPHQDAFQLPETALHVIPDAVPSRRATLAANMETALNAHWDAGTTAGDRVLVVGAGIVGLLVAYIAKRMAGTEVAVADVDPHKAGLAKALGLRFVEPDDVPTDHRIVFHTSATGSGLQTAFDACAFEGSVIEMSWYGSEPVTIDLGGVFHSRRLKLIASQVGHVALRQRPAVTRNERLRRALALLDEPALDVLVDRDCEFADLPQALPGIWASTALPPVVIY